MKKLLAMLFMLCLAGGVQADILTNNGVASGFETSHDDGFGSQISDGFAVWSSDWGVIDHETEYTSDTGVVAHSGDGYWMLAGGGNPAPQTSVGSALVPATPGETYTFGCWIKIDPANVPSLIEFGFDQYSLGGGWARSDTTVIIATANWQYFEYTSVAGGISIAPKLAPFGTSEANDGRLYTDDWKLVNPALAGQATDPDPADGTDVPINLPSLSWNNPDDPNDVITCAVYLEAEGTDASGTNPSNIDPNFASGPIATGITDGTILLADYGITLEDDMWYSWRVDSSQPDALGGDPVVTQSALWTFHIGDTPPTVTAGDNQYLWLTMEDGDGDSAKVTFNLSGTYTDDGKSDITTAQWVQGAHEGGGTVTIENQNWDAGTNTVTAEVTATGNGWLFLSLELTDASGTGTDELNVGVYGTCIEAANEDPADVMYQSYAHGDIDGDCDTDLNDLAIMAGTWGDCMTTKAGCTP